MGGNVAADFSSNPALDDGDLVRPVGYGFFSTVRFSRRSGQYLGCEEMTVCTSGYCRTHWLQSVPVAITNQWVVSYPANNTAPDFVFAKSEDWSGQFSLGTKIPVIILANFWTPGCTPRIELVP
jgi:hypothetical protein